MSFDPSTAVLIEDDPPAFDAASAVPVEEEPMAFDPASAVLVEDEPALPAATPSPVPTPNPELDAARDAGMREDQRIREEGIFPEGSQSWKVLDGRIYIDPARYNSAVENLWSSGVIDSDSYTELLKGTVDQYDEATRTVIPSVEKATAARRDLERRAGAYPEVKSAASGLLKGAMQTGAAIVGGGAAATATGFTGPGAVAVGIGAGTAAALGTGYAYDKALELSSKESDLLDSFYAANQLKPGYNTGGQLVSILAPTPVSISRLANAANLIQAEKGSAAAAKFVTGAFGAGAGIGVATDATIQVANLGLDKLLHQDISKEVAMEHFRQTGEQLAPRPQYNPASTGLSAIFGGLGAGLGVKARNKTYAPEELVTLETQVKTGRASRQEAEDYRVMRQAVDTLRADERLLDAQAIRRATVDAAGFRFLDTTEIINPRFQRELLAYAAENPQAAVPLAGSPAAYSGQAFLNRGGPAPAFQGGTNALPGPEGIQALPAPAAVNPQVNPPQVSNDTMNGWTGRADMEPGLTGDMMDDMSAWIGESWKDQRGTPRFQSAEAAWNAYTAVDRSRGVAVPGKRYFIEDLYPAITNSAPTQVSNDTFDPTTATPVDDIPPTASAPVASTLTAPESTGSPELIAGEGATTPPPAKSKRRFPRISYDPGTFPILAALQESPVRPSKSGKAGGENDNWNEIRRTGRHFAETHRSTGQPYDVRAQELYELGLLPDPYPDTLFNAYMAEVNSYRQIKDGDPQQAEYDKLEKQYDNFSKAALEPADSKKAKLQPISSSNLQIGDKVKIGNEWLNVKAIDPETFTISLQDGTKFGLQKVEDGTQMWVQEAELAAPPTGDIDNFFGEPIEPPQPAKKPAGALFSEEEMPFNLISDPIESPVKVLSAQEEEAARAATVRQGGYENTPSLFEEAPAKSRSGSKVMADAGPPTPIIPTTAPLPKPALETYNDAQVFADYPDAVGVSRADNGVWTMPVILGGLDKVPIIEMPEAVEFFKSLSGNNPQIRVPRKRGALGTFLPAGNGYITLRPDLIAAGGEASANMVFMHEAGHFIQFMDDFKMQKGNLLGIIAGARSTKHSMPLDPAAAQGDPITKKQREAIRRRAEEDLRASLEGEVRRVLVEEPVYAQSGVTPEIVKSLFGLTAREQWPELYDWFAKQDGATKKAIVKQAMKGIVDSRLAKFQVQGEQIGTNTREEVQNIGGREPTPDELREAFHAAMRAEMSARNVADFKYIRQELIDLTRWWKPFDMATAPDSYIKYRLSAEELFADAMSVLLNSPADLKARAPIFYETFWNHLDTRPQVKAKLIDIYDRINKGRDNVLGARQERDWQNYAKGDKAFLDAFEKATSRRNSLTGLWDDLRDQYWDEFFPLTSAIDKARAEGKLPSAENDPYRYLTEEHPMADSRLQLRMMDMQRVLLGLDEAGISRFYLDDYLIYTRIAREKYEVKEMVDGEMQTIGYEQSPTKFNPGGETARTAQERLDYMQANMKPEQWAALEAAAKAFREQFQDVLKFYWEEGMLTDDLWQKFSTNENYATFTVLDYVKEYTSSRMVGRKGTVKAVARPTVEMPKKLITMFRAAQRNKFKRVMGGRLVQSTPEIARPAPMRFNGKFMEPKPPSETGWKLVTWREKGQLVGAHIQDRWAEALDQHSPAMGDAILKSLNWGFRNSIYNLIIKWNPNFQLFTGPIKDFGRALVNQPGGVKGRAALVKNIAKEVLELSKSRDGRRVLMEFTGTSLAGIAGATGGAALGTVGGVPGMVLGGVVGGNAASYAGFFAGRVFANALESLPWLPDDPTASVDWARGDIGRSALMREMIENYAIGGPWAYLGRGVANNNPDHAIDALMGKFHVGGQPKPLPWIYRQVANYLNDVELAGQILQNIPKTSSYKTNTRTLGMDKAKAAYWVRNHIGLPNTYKKGKHIGNFQALAPFANIFVRSFESMGKLITGREGKTMSWQEYVLAFFIAGGGVAAIMQRLAKEGVLGEDLAKTYAGSSEYDISNKGIVPLGTVDSPTGTKSALLTLPLDENNRLLFATISKLTKAMVRMAQGRPLDVEGFDIISGFTATLPGMNPVVEVGDKWGQFFTGKSPVNHRNQPILSEDEQKAGGLYALKPMVGWTLNETGVSNFFKYDARANTYTEAAIGAVPAFNRFLKITDQGTRETMRTAQAGEDKFKAIKRLDMPAQVKALRQEYYWLRSRGDARNFREEDRYRELQSFENLFQSRMEEADTANTLGNQAEVNFAIRSIIQESQLYKTR
jgi:hypothetical protein